jgi:polygalacturonase
MHCPTKRRVISRLLQAYALGISSLLAPAFAKVAQLTPVQPGVKRGGRQLNVRDFGAKGDGQTNDTHAFQRAILFATNELAGKSDLYVPSGVYVVGDLVAPSGVVIAGEGGTSVLRQLVGAQYLLSLTLFNDSDAASSLALRHITLRHLHFSGWVDERSFSEHVHLLNINGCTNLNIEHCEFSGFCGDGIYIGSGNKAGTERHNRDVSIRHCTFDGINGNNRNAISVIDCDGLTVENCVFVNCSRHDMPGAIDIEPDAQKFHRIRNVIVRNNRISRCTGGVAAISVYLPIHDFDQPPQNIRIEGNRIDGNFTTSGISVRVKGDVRDRDPLLDIFVLNNTVTRTLVPLVIGGSRGVLVEENTFESSYQAVLIAYPSHGKCADVALKNNRFFRLGQRGMHGMRVFLSRRVSIIENVFRDCGLENGGTGVALDVAATSPSIPEIRQNHFEGSDTARRIAVALPMGVTLDTAPNIKFDNTYSANIVPAK